MSGVLVVLYVDSGDDYPENVTTPSGFEFRCSPEWICDQIEAGHFLLVSLIDDDTIRENLG